MPVSSWTCTLVDEHLLCTPVPEIQFDANFMADTVESDAHDPRRTILELEVYIFASIGVHLDVSNTTCPVPRDPIP